MSVYLKDGSVLLNGGSVAIDAACCDSCCPAITLTCDSISSSKSKCGFKALHIVDCTPPFTDHGYSASLDFVGCCSNFGNCATSGGASVDQNTYYLTRDFSFSGHTETGTECFGCGSLCGSGSGSYSYDPLTCVGSGDTFDCGGSCCVSGNWTLNVEYTTGMLIANTEATLPPYDDDYDDSCSASRDLSDDELTYSIQRFKPKFTIASPRTSDLTICYNEHFVPDVGDPIDTPRSITIPSGETEIVGAEITEPDENGVITITDVDCCSCSFSHNIQISLIGTCGLDVCACTLCPVAYSGDVPLIDPVTCTFYVRVDGIDCCSCTSGTCDTSLTFVEITVMDNVYPGAQVDVSLNQGFNGCPYPVILTAGSGGEFPGNVGVAVIPLTPLGICSAGDAELVITLL